MKMNNLEIGDQIKYQALGGKTTGIVKAMMDDVLLVFVAPESYILVHRTQVIGKSSKL